MDVLRRLLAPAEARTAQLSAAELIARDRGFATYAGVPVNERTAMSHLTVWSCVRLITDSVAMMPVHTFEQAGEELPQRVADPDVIDRPHSEMTRSEWHTRMLWSVLIRGNAYGEILSVGRGGIPTQIEPLHPNEVVIDRDTSGRLRYLIGSERRPVMQERMMHIPGIVVPGNVYGLDPISYARQTIGTGLAAVEYGARFFSEGAVPPGVLTTEQKLDTDTALDYQDRWTEAHGNRSRKVAVLGGGLHYDAVQLSPEASQFLATQELTKGDIAGFYGVPPHMIGDVDRSTSWGTGIEEQTLGFVTYTLGPWLRRLEDAWRGVLGGKLYARYNTNALLRSRALDRAAFYRTMREVGAFNIDDIRAHEELAPLPDGMGQDYLQPLNYAPIPPGGGAAQPADVTPASP
jgi:HK97 family phage portal protein